MWFKKSVSADSSGLVSSLQAEKLKTSIILNAIEDGVILVDGQGIIRLMNPSAATITGWKVEEAEGIDWHLVFKFVDTKSQAIPEDQVVLSKVFKATQSMRDNNANLLTKANKLTALSISVSPLLGTNSTVTGAVAIFRDVSRERQEESQRADFISTASHEMRTPVAAIEGYLSLALNDKVATIDARARNYLEKAHASTQHLGQLFQDLLTSAKAEDGRLTSHPVAVEVGGFVEQLVSDLKFSAEKKGLFMEFMIGASNQSIDATTKVVRPLYYAFIDPDRMREVVINIFDNAVKYTDEGKITLGLTGNDQVVQLYVRDTGPGIPTEDVPHLFQKFYRVDNSSTRTIGGTGLGLFICRKIVELYQGRIWVESEVGKGSTFYINVPRLTTQKAEQLMKEQSSTGTSMPANTTTSVV